MNNNLIKEIEQGINKYIDLMPGYFLDRESTSFIHNSDIRECPRMILTRYYNLMNMIDNNWSELEKLNKINIYIFNRDLRINNKYYTIGFIYDKNINQMYLTIDNADIEFSLKSFKDKEQVKWERKININSLYPINTISSITDWRIDYAKYTIGVYNTIAQQINNERESIYNIIYNKIINDINNYEKLKTLIFRNDCKLNISISDENTTHNEEFTIKSMSYNHYQSFVEVTANPSKPHYDIPLIQYEQLNKINIHNVNYKITVHINENETIEFNQYDCKIKWTNNEVILTV